MKCKQFHFGPLTRLNCFPFRLVGYFTGLHHKFFWFPFLKDEVANKEEHTCKTSVYLSSNITQKQIFLCSHI